ncbi:MAG: hypothetical protein HY264_04980 [Chloroflexi bacterium]|nr:hypothetical protein [Chloroflexota bacterium]
MARSDGQLTLFLPKSGGVYAATSKPDRPGRAMVYLSTLGGDTGAATNSFVFGNAPPDATSVVIQPGRETGKVEGGLFLVGLAQKDLLPTNLAWQFLSSAGTVVQAGTGISG